MRKMKMCEIELISLQFFVIAWSISGCFVVGIIIGRISKK